MTMQRLGILGDIHAEDGALRVALEHLAGEGLDSILAVGDIVDGPGSVDATCDLLRDHDVIAVRGNHERWFLRGEMRHLPDATRPTTVSTGTLAFLHGLPATRRLHASCGDILLCHGVGEDDMCTVKPDDFGYAIEVNEPLQRLVRAGEPLVVVCGHSHHRMVRSFGPVTLVNAGTLLRGHRPCFGVLDTGARHVTYFERREGDDIAVSDVLPF
jgi:predicted phosphodiesterase